MILQEYQISKQLTQEKADLERALTTVQEALQTTSMEKEQLMKIFTDFKAHYETVQAQSHTYQKRLIDEMSARKQLEDQFEQRLN